MEKPLVIELDQADPLDRGRAYGEAARDRIGLNLDVYRDVFVTVTGKSWEEILGRGRVIRPLAQDYAPDLMTEIEGVAQGAGRSFEEIFLLNARSEIIFSAAALGIPEADECTSLLALPETTRAGHTLLAQNWDWFEPVTGGQVILKIAARPPIPALVTFTEAGQVAKMGFNDAGLGLAVNNLTTDRPRPGVPWLLITRRILESSRLTEAAGHVHRARRAHSINYLIGTHQGDQGFGVDLETAAAQENVFWPQNGFLAHTNHFVGPTHNFEDIKQRRDPFSSTRLRLARTRSLLDKKRGDLDENAIKTILADHFDHPYSVCVHNHPYSVSPRPVITCLSLILNLTRKTAHYHVGNPCRDDWETIGV